VIAVRPATVADVPVLIELMADFYGESSFPLDRSWAAQAFSDLLHDPSRGAVWLLEVDGDPAGHVVLSVRFAMEFGGLLAYIDDLFVKPAYRRQGVARAGLETLLEDCRRRRCRAVHVEVAPDNAAANALYRRIGLAPGLDARLQLTAVLPRG
jgi:ribosomal protein S18 acetylase RimI-like enzyme